MLQGLGSVPGSGRDPGYHVTDAGKVGRGVKLVTHLISCQGLERAEPYLLYTLRNEAPSMRV